MKTRKDAERAVELCKQRDDLHKEAGAVRLAERIGVFKRETDAAPWNGHKTCDEFIFEHLTDELRELIRKELQAQIAAIDKELQRLGIAPDEFEAEAPKEAAPSKSKKKPEPRLPQWSISTRTIPVPVYPAQES